MCRQLEKVELIRHPEKISNSLCKKKKNKNGGGAKRYVNTDNRGEEIIGKKRNQDEGERVNIPHRDDSKGNK